MFDDSIKKMHIQKTHIKINLQLPNVKQSLLKRKMENSLYTKSLPFSLKPKEIKDILGKLPEKRFLFFCRKI